jgi:hypothetical protein
VPVFGDQRRVEFASSTWRHSRGRSGFPTCRARPVLEPSRDGKLRMPTRRFLWCALPG